MPRVYYAVMSGNKILNKTTFSFSSAANLFDGTFKEIDNYIFYDEKEAQSYIDDMQGDLKITRISASFQLGVY